MYGQIIDMMESEIKELKKNGFSRKFSMGLEICAGVVKNKPATNLNRELLNKINTIREEQWDSTEEAIIEKIGKIILCIKLSDEYVVFA